LAARHPIHVVTKWLGNSPRIAWKHYLQVTDADYERASAPTEEGENQAAQKAAQQMHAGPRNKPQSTKAAHEKTPVFPGFAKSCDPVLMSRLEAAGIEPASRDRSAKASTCVVGCLISLMRSPADRVAHQPARNEV